MSIAATCTCGKSPVYCIGGEGCKWKSGKPMSEFFIENNCTEEEVIQMKAFVFALRHKDVDIEMLERIIKKYKHLL